MANNQNRYVVERRIMTDGALIDKKLNLLNRMYNNAVRHFRQNMVCLKKDVWYQELLESWKSATDEDERERLVKEICKCAKWFGLSESNIHAYLGHGKNQSNDKGINIDVLQKTGSALYASIKKAIFADTTIHFRKKGTTNSMSAKKTDSGIIYHAREDTVLIMGHEFPLKPVRKKDFWLMEALHSRVVYCQVVRRAYKNGYRYFLQLVMEGFSPKKFECGTGRCGIDQGPSAIAVCYGNRPDFIPLAKDIRKYEKDILYWQRTYERRRRMANPQCYNENGTIRKGSVFSNWTHGVMEALMRLKAAWAKKTAYVRQQHGHLTNVIVQNCDEIVLEPMNWRALARRAKKTARQEKVTRVRKRNGQIINIHKFSKKKRFGKSIGRHSPGLLTVLIKQKAQRYKIPILEIDPVEFRASQLDHSTGEYKKHGVSERTRKVGGHLVQRDSYSAWLTVYAVDTKHPSLEACTRNFKEFLKNQGKLVSAVLREGDVTGNFGLRDFVSA